AIKRAWKTGGEIRATLQLSARDDVAGIVRDIADGIISAVSIGYRVKTWRDETDSKGNRSRTAVAWSIHEASFVPIGADAGAVTRSNPMKKAKTGAGSAPEAESHESETANENTPTVAQTRAAIRDIIERAGGTPAQADELIDADATEEQARSAAYDIMQARTASAPRVRVIVSNDDPAVTLERRTEALACRAGGASPSDAARPFVALSIVDHARDMLEASGVRVRGMTTEQILTRAMHTISDFPELLTGTGARLLKPAYDAASSPLVALARKVTANDFRTQTMLQLGELPKLQKVTESGEIKSVTRGEAKETWALDTYGAIFSLSRKALINDDLNAFSDFATAGGQAAAATVADLLVSVLTQSGGRGPVMGDGERLFDLAAHGNAQEMSYNTAEPVSAFVNSIASARISMLLQKGVDAATIINVRPDTIIVPPSLLTLAEQAVATITPATVDAVSPVQTKFAIVCEPRLEAVSTEQWYVADSSLAALVLGGLAGNEGPQFASREGFDVLGREFRVTLDVGVGPNDWRGWFRTTAESSNSDI
ncbi:MAG: peptidase, partial [Hyphomonadaceae bacterium]